MTKQQEQQLIEAIILALHPECETWDQVIKKLIEKSEITLSEDYGDGIEHINKYAFGKWSTISDEAVFWPLDKNCKRKFIAAHPNTIIKNETFSEFPKLTIGMIMKALGDGYWFDGKTIYSDDHNYGDMTEEFMWKLTKDNGIECTLEDQSEEVKQALYNIFVTNTQ